MALTYPFKIGDFDCLVIQAGFAVVDDVAERLPGAAAEEIQEVMSLRGLEEVVSSYNVLYMDTGEYQILVDTGLHFEPVADALSVHQINPSEIDFVVLTHFHGDHIGGLFTKSGDVAFPKARYCVWKTEWDYWNLPQSLANRDETFKQFMHSRLELIGSRLDLLTNSNRIVPGILPVWLPGHLPGHIGLMIESAGKQLLHIADSVHYLPQLANTDWSIKFDLDPRQAAISRLGILSRAAKEHIFSIAYHLPFPGLGHFKCAEQGFMWDPAVLDL